MNNIDLNQITTTHAVLHVSGQCYHDCPDGQIEVPYGTNFPGQTVCYKTQRPGLEEGFGQIESCAPQLTQSAHTALQLPYTIFGLGLAPNFLDYMFVNVTNATDHSRGHTWSQVRSNFIYRKLLKRFDSIQNFFHNSFFIKFRCHNDMFSIFLIWSCWFKILFDIN